MSNDALDAARYRWLRDHTGNTIMRKLMKECQPSRWDELVDKDRKANAPTSNEGQ